MSILFGIFSIGLLWVAAINLVRLSILDFFWVTNIFTKIIIFAFIIIVAVLSVLGTYSILEFIRAL